MIVSQALGYEIVRIGIAIGAFWWVRISNRYPRRLAHIATKKLSTAARFQPPAEIYISHPFLTPLFHLFLPVVFSLPEYTAPPDFVVLFSLAPLNNELGARRMRCDASHRTPRTSSVSDMNAASPAQPPNAFRTAKAKKEKEKEAFRSQWPFTHR